MALSDRIELDIDVPFYLPNIGVYKVALHFIQALFSLLVSSLIGAVISYQNNDKEDSFSSQSNSKFTLVVAIGSLFIALTLAMVPISKLRIKPLKSIGSFFLRPRTDLVLNIFMSLSWLIASIVVTTQALEQNSYIHEYNIQLINSNEDNLNRLRTQCNSIKAAAAFSWLGLFTWMATVISSLILFCNHKQLNKSKNSVYSEKEDSYIPSSPSSYDADAPTIVEMQYSEKHKQPIVSYNDYNTTFYDPVQVSNHTTMYNNSMYIPDSHHLTTTTTTPYLPQMSSHCITAEQVYTQHTTTSSFSSPYTTADPFMSTPYTSPPSVQFPTYHKY